LPAQESPQEEAVFPWRTILPGAPLLVMGQVFASVVRYNRLGAKDEARNGGTLRAGDLGRLLTSWAHEALDLLNVKVTRSGVPPNLEMPTIFVGNHVSYLDIPLLLSQVPVAFLGKAEIAGWPILGSAGRRAGMIFIQREVRGSRIRAARAIVDAMGTRDLGLALFPSGTTSVDESIPWRSGAFTIAKAGAFPVQPFRVAYTPMARAAFVGNDYLLPHLYRLLKDGRLSARIEFGAPRMVEDPRATALELWHWSRGLI
jgi:1-acyl-sn-glycerol-3-phosphate acyltransferase